MPQETTVFPIPGRFVPDEPLVKHKVESKAEADRLVATGGFALSEKEANEQAYTTPPAVPIQDSAPVEGAQEPEEG